MGVVVVGRDVVAAIDVGGERFAGDDAFICRIFIFEACISEETEIEI